MKDEGNASSLSPGWASAPLHKIAALNPALGQDVSDSVAVSFVPMAAVEELTGRLDPTNTRPFGEVKKGFTRFRDGDLVFAKITPSMENGKVALASNLKNGIGCGTTELHVIRPNPGVSGRYLMHFLLQSSFREIAKRNMKGTAGQLRVPIDFLANSEVPVPPSGEQERIVAKIDELFSDIEEGERCLARAEALLKQYRQSVLKAAVTGELTRDWREKSRGKGETGADLLRRILAARREAWEKMGRGGKYVEPMLPKPQHKIELPADWTWATVDQLSLQVQYGSSAKCTATEDGVPVLRMGNIVDGDLDTDDLKFLPRSHDEFPELLLQPGDLLFNRTNSAELVGKTAVYDGRFKECSFASYLIRVRVAGCEPRFLRSFINSVFGRQWVKSVVSQQVGQANVNGSKLRALAVPLPPLAEQEFAMQMTDELLAALKRLISEIRLLSMRARDVRQSVLCSAYSGKLVPQDADDEPASALLARIAAERAAVTPAKPRHARRVSAHS